MSFIGAAMEHLIPIAMKGAQPLVDGALKAGLPSVEDASRKAMEGSARAALKKAGDIHVNPALKEHAAKIVPLISDHISPSLGALPHAHYNEGLGHFAAETTDAHAAARRLLPTDFAKHTGIREAKKPLPPTLYDQQLSGFGGIWNRIRP